MEQYIVNGKVFLDGSFQEKTIGVEGDAYVSCRKTQIWKAGQRYMMRKGKR